MYFTARVNGASHIWRQRFPDGALEQLTFGPAEESGIAVSADGRSLLTSAGMFESGVWLHNATGDRLISAEGYASNLSYVQHGRSLYYLLRREVSDRSTDLWRTDMDSGRSERVITGFDISAYDVSPDGTMIVFSARNGDGPSQLWTTELETGTQPRLLASDGNTPFFVEAGNVLFRMADGVNNYLFELKRGERQPTKILRTPILELKGISPDRSSAVVMISVPEVPSTAVVAVSLRDGSTSRICPANCTAKWSPDGGRFYVEPRLQGTDGGKAVVLPVPMGAQLPALPAYGVRSASDAAALPGSTVIDLTAFDPAQYGATVVPGPSADTFAFTKTISHRNVFRVDLPQ
jgi:hypothetical protein